MAAEAGSFKSITIEPKSKNKGEAVTTKAEKRLRKQPLCVIIFPMRTYVAAVHTVPQFIRKWFIGVFVW